MTPTPRPTAHCSNPGILAAKVGVAAGGLGGGVIVVTVGSILQLDGSLRVDGGGGSAGGGGGSGGSVFITVGESA